MILGASGVSETYFHHGRRIGEQIPQCSLEQQTVLERHADAVLKRDRADFSSWGLLRCLKPDVAYHLCLWFSLICRHLLGEQLQSSKKLTKLMKARSALRMAVQPLDLIGYFINWKIYWATLNILFTTVSSVRAFFRFFNLIQKSLLWSVWLSLSHRETLSCKSFLLFFLLPIHHAPCSTSFPHSTLFCITESKYLNLCTNKNTCMLL